MKNIPKGVQDELIESMSQQNAKKEALSKKEAKEVVKNTEQKPAQKVALAPARETEMENKLQEIFGGRIEELKQKKGELEMLRKNLSLEITTDQLLDAAKELALHEKQEDLRATVNELQARWEDHKKDSRDLSKIIEDAKKAGNEAIVKRAEKARKEMFDQEMALVKEMEEMRKVAMVKETEKPAMKKEEVKKAIPGELSAKEAITTALDLTVFLNTFAREKPELAKKYGLEPYKANIGKILDAMEEQVYTKKLLELKKEVTSEKEKEEEILEPA